MLNPPGLSGEPDHVPFRIKTILEYIPLVETTRGTVGIFGAAMVG